MTGTSVNSIAESLHPVIQSFSQKNHPKQRVRFLRPGSLSASPLAHWIFLYTPQQCSFLQNTYSHPSTTTISITVPVLKPPLFFVPAATQKFIHSPRVPLFRCILVEMSLYLNKALLLCCNIGFSPSCLGMGFIDFRRMRTGRMHCLPPWSCHIRLRSIYDRLKVGYSIKLIECKRFGNWGDKERFNEGTRRGRWS